MNAASHQRGPISVLRRLRLGQKVALVMLASCLPLAGLAIQVADFAAGMVRDESLENLRLSAQLESDRINSQVDRLVADLVAVSSDDDLMVHVDALGGPSRGQAPAAIGDRLRLIRDQFGVNGLQGIQLKVGSQAVFEPSVEEGQDPRLNKVSNQTLAAASAMGTDEAVTMSDAFITSEREVRVSIVIQINPSGAPYQVLTEWDLAELLRIEQRAGGVGHGADLTLIARGALLGAHEDLDEMQYAVLMSTGLTNPGQQIELPFVPVANSAVVAQTRDASDREVVQALARTSVEPRGWIVMVEVDAQQLFAGIETLRGRIIAAFIGASLVILGVISLLLRFLVRRLARITALAEAVTLGDLSVRTGDSRSDEVGRLSRAFDEMTEALAHDIARRERVEAQLAYQATHDSLTGLPNRQQLIDELDRVLDEGEDQISVLFVDLDGFKEVNDRLGHAAGDELLTRVGERLRTVLRPHDFLARLGGDEFVIVLRGRSLLEGERLAERVVASLELPFIISDDDVQISASIGVSSASDADRSSEALLQEADLAMYRAKALGKARAERATPEALDANLEQLAVARELRDAVNNGELEVMWIPVGDLRDGTVQGLEASPQWRHRERGLLAPGDFMAMARSTGLATSIEEWLITAAVDQFAEWDRLGYGIGDVELSLGISEETFLSHRVRHHLSDELLRHGMRGQQIRLEVPEPVLGRDPSALTPVFDAYRALGVPISLARFGSGMSHPELLPRYAVDAVNVDVSQMLDRPGQEASRALVGSLFALARTAGLRVTASGVDTDELRREMLAMECLTGQGRWLSEPLESARAASLLQQRYILDAR